MKDIPPYLYPSFTILLSLDMNEINYWLMKGELDAFFY